MRKLMIGGLYLTALALMAFSRAKADGPIGPPAPGSHVIIYQPMIACDTKEQIKQIAEAKLKSDDAAEAKFEEYAKVMDSHNEASCMFGKLQMAVTVGESVALPDLKFGDTEVSAWAVLVGIPRGNWWCMFIAPKSIKHEDSI